MPQRTAANATRKRRTLGKQDDKTGERGDRNFIVFVRVWKRADRSFKLFSRESSYVWLKNFVSSQIFKTPVLGTEFSPVNAPERTAAQPDPCRVSLGTADASSLGELLQDLLPANTPAQTINAALPAVYDELRTLATSYLRRERPNHTLQPTALVHESYLRLVNQRTVDWGNRLQFLSIAARIMRRILSDHAQARAADKRGGGAPKLQLDAALEFCDQRAISIAAVDQALRDLETMDARQAQVVRETGMEHSAALAPARDRRGVLILLLVILILILIHS